MKVHTDLLGYISTERTALKIGGFYPIKAKKCKNLHRASATFFLSLTVLYVILAFIHGFLNLTNVTVLSEIVTFLMTELAYIVKILNLFYYKSNLLLMEDMLQNPILTVLESEEEEVSLKNNLKFSRLFTNIYKMNATIAASVHAIYPLIDNHVPRHFLFLLWFPFNPDNHYVKVYFFEALLLISSTWLDITLDSLNILMMDLCATQFQLLSKRFNKISLILTGNEELDDKLRLERLREYVNQHNYIYGFSEIVRSTYSVGEFSQVVCSVLIVCFGLFKSLVTPLKSMQFFMIASYSLTMIYQVSLYCCYGQKLLNASSTITEACYMSEWNKCSVNVQKNLVMIMSRANTPVIMKAGGIFSLTLETLMTICTSSYSFFAILWQVYNTEE